MSIICCFSINRFFKSKYSIIPLGFKSNLDFILSTISSSGIVLVPNVSIYIETGFATPILYAN